MPGTKKLYNIRYYALGHSYLRHGVFNGWPWEDAEKGPRGMAASSFDKDYFARFKYYLEQNFNCNIESEAKNIALYERICVDGATKEDYISSEHYKSAKEYLEAFHPNLVTVFLGGGNTVANDYKNISVFFDTLFEMIREAVGYETLVIAVNQRSQEEDVGKACREYAGRYKIPYCDVSFIHADKSRENPYYAYKQYPEYDNFIEEFTKQNGKAPVEFRTHPGDLGMDAIGKAIFDIAAPLIPEFIKPVNVSAEEYNNIKKIAIDQRESISANNTVANLPADRFDFNTDDFSEGVVFSGFNVFVKNSFLCGNSAPGTSFNIYHNKLSLSSANYNTFKVKMNLRHNSDETTKDTFELTITADEKIYKYTAEISTNKLKEYVFDISDVNGTITGFNIAPSMPDCNADVDYIAFE